MILALLLISVAALGPQHPIAQSVTVPVMLATGNYSDSQSEIKATLPTRLAAQNQLFKEQFDDDMKASPETATAYGNYRYNDMLDSRSLLSVAHQNAIDLNYKARLEAISTVGFPEQDRISHDLLLQVLEQRISDYRFKNYEMPLSQMEGIHTQLADLPLAVPLDTVQHYEDYIARLHQFPRAFSETIELLRQAIHDGLMPVRFLLDKVASQCEGTIAENPFLAPIHKFPSSFSTAEKLRLSASITSAVNAEVLPSYRDFAKFVATEYAPHGRADLGLSSLPDGVRRYQNAIREQTTTNMSPEEIESLGMSEVARINALLSNLAHKEGYKDLPSFRQAALTNSKYVPKSGEQIVEDFRHYVAQMQPRLPELFGIVPQTPMTVEALPPSQPGNATHYIPGTPDGKRPGRIIVATSNFANRKMIGDETIAYHEGIPGHHMQISIQQRLTGMPDFRLHLINNAYAEGWAVYAEALGKEIGFFQDPVSDYGRLSTELIRAVRLVVDTGIHSRGWSRDRAVTYFRDSNAADEPTIQAEIDRYIAWPAQSLSYKIGQLKIRELRDRAKQWLGPRFDLRIFHDEILSGGNLPLDMLETRINRWISAQLNDHSNSVPN